MLPGWPDKTGRGRGILLIKLIASDMDGTLIRQRGMPLDPVVYELIDRFAEKGVLFAAASGRQYQSLLQLFAPVRDKMAFICENGGFTCWEGQEEAIYMPREDVWQIMREILEIDFCDVLLSGEKCCYISPRTREYGDWIIYHLKNITGVVDDLFSVPGEFVKVSAYAKGRAAEIAPPLQERWGKKYHVAIAGDRWVDISLADKGMALQKLRTHLGLQREEVLAFGDNFNDIQMLAEAGYGYAMAASDPQVKACCGYTCERVEDILQKLLETGLPV